MLCKHITTVLEQLFLDKLRKTMKTNVNHSLVNVRTVHNG